jgi:4-amino-4-deoxy-L-arabinose transferase-like glycosyltransferase
VRFAVLLLVAVAALAFFAGLGRPAITDSDEAFYAEAAREMVAGGDWLTPHFNFEYRFQKPILFYWITAGFYKVAGVDEVPARLGAALAGLGIVLIAFAVGRRWYDEATGLLAGAIVATSYGCVFGARVSLPDLPLAFFITLATWAASMALGDRTRRARRWWLLAGLAAALGFLTKGPVAAVIPVLAVAVPAITERAWRRVALTDLALAAAVFLLVGAPWYVAMTAVHGPAYLAGFFVGDNLERFATTTFNAHRPVYFYVPIVLGGMLPWSPYLALGVSPLVRALRQRHSLAKPDLRVICWTLAPFLLYTASVGKQPRYVLPMLAPLGVLLAVWIRRVVTSLPPLPWAQPRLFRWMTALSALLTATLAFASWRVRPLLVDIAPVRHSLLVGALAAASAAGLIVAASRHWRRAPAVTAAAALVVILVMRYALFSLPGLDPVEQMAARVVAHRAGSERLATYRAFVRNLVFYTHVHSEDLSTPQGFVEFMDTPERVLCVIRARDLKWLGEVAREPGAGRLPAVLSQVRPLESLTYFDVSTAKLRAFLAPDLTRDMQTAVLIANR